MAAPLSVNAEERSLDEMMAAAQQALTAGGMHRAPAMGSVDVPQLLAQRAQTSVFGYSDGGFAVISHDDALPAVMAYGDGNYAQVIANPSFANYLSTFDGYLNYCAEKGIEPRFINKKADFNPAGVKEIMKCRWDQGSPYNLMCPFVYRENDKKEMEDARCITGCVATAMAQILYTLHQKFGTEIKLRGAKHYYYIDANQRLAFESANLASIPLDWDNMLDTYSATTGHMQNMAVARLMYACGVASEMIYKPGESGTYCSTANDGLNDFFEGIKATYSGYGIGDEWAQKIYDELDAGRPVMLSGANAENGGHCFVGDGYDKDGKIHLNLGWSGGGNTWTTIADMGGFVQAQTVNSIVPEENDVLKLSKDAPLDELAGKYITADLFHPAEDIIEGQWYVLYNKGRYASAYSTGLGKKLQCSHYVPVADPAEIAAPMVVRFIAKTGTKQYFIQTGTGDYFGGLDYGTNYGSESQPSFPYSWGKVSTKQKKYFYFKQGSTILDCNAPGGQGVAGWGTQIPTDTLGHAAWMLLPVHFSDSPEIPTIGPNNFDPDHRYVLINYDGAKNYYFNLKATCSIAPKNPTELRLTRANGGWQISSFADENLVVSAKSKDFKLGNNSVAGEYPLTFSFEPIDEEISTGDPDVDACSRFYRIRCESGYLAPTKIALGGNIYNNLGFHTPLVRWQLIDQTELDELLLDGVDTPLAPTVSSTSDIYDLTGRRVSTAHGGLYIQNGKKIMR